MASIIRIKRSGVTGSPPNLAQGELAYSYLAGTQNNGGDRLYIGTGTETDGVAANIKVIGGEYFTEMLNHVPGTLTANSAIITNSNSEIDTIKFSDITITGNTITTTLSNSNLVLNPAGTGSIDVSNATIINLGNPSANTDAVNKLYVDTEIAELGRASNLDIAGNTGNTSIILASETFHIIGGTGISTDATSANNTLIVTLNDTTVSANTYGSTTAIPVLTINAQGQITAASTATISTSFNLYGDTGVQDISGGGSYIISGGDGLSVNTGNDRIDITLDNTAVVANTYGSSTSVGTFAVDGQGRLTAASSVSIAIPSTQVTDFTEAVQDVVGAFTSGNSTQGITVTYTDSANTLNITAEDASDSQKGVASFSGEFLVTDGNVILRSGAIINSKLANSSITVGTTEINLGSGSTIIAGLQKVTVDFLEIDGNSISSTAGDIVLSPFEDGTVNVSDSRIVNVSDPIDPKDATNKQYVDAVAQGLKILPQALAFSDIDLSATYNNGTAGVGATLTSTSNVTFPDVDGIAIALNDNVILNGQTNKAQNGSYILTTVGSAGTPWVLTRAPFIDQASEMEGSFEFVTSGTTYGNTGWVLTSLTEPVVVGTTELLWVQFSGAGTYTAGVGLTLTGTEFTAKVDGTSIGINVSDQIEVKDAGITNVKIADGTIENIKLVNSIITIEDDAANTDVLALGETIKINGGTGITTAITANNTLIISGDDATASVKGVASFDANNFIVSSGNVTLNVEGVQDIVAGYVQGGRAITITYTDSANTITFDANLATTSTVGVAKFNSANFAVDNAGDVTVTVIDGGTYV